MSSIVDVLSNLANQTGFASLDWKNYVMILVAFVFMFLAIKFGFEPLLLVPISFGMLLVNMFPDIMAGRSEEHTSELQSRVELECRLLLENKMGGGGGGW